MAVSIKQSMRYFVAIKFLYSIFYVSILFFNDGHIERLLLMKLFF